MNERKIIYKSSPVFLIAVERLGDEWINAFYNIAANARPIEAQGYTSN